MSENKMTDPIRLLLLKNEFARIQAIKHLTEGCPENGEVSRETIAKIIGHAFDLGVISEGSAKN